MSLSNDIITHQLDPVIFNQRRCEFRIDPKVYLSNWRLGDLGVVPNGGGTNLRYASHLGSYALIDRIRLLNGSVELAELRNVNQYLAFENLQRTNSNAFNVNRTLNKSSFALDLQNDAGRPMDLKAYAENDTKLGSTTAANAPLSFLDLQQVLPLLKAQSYILGTELQSLRLVIEWVPSTPAAFSKVFVGNTMPNSIAIVQPSLIIDEVADKAMASKLKNAPIQYINMDHEVVNVPPNVSGTQQINQRLRAFDDKLVRRILMLSEDAQNAQPSSYFAGLTSYAQYKQQVQFSLNGMKLLPYNGIENENQQLAMLHDTYGTHILPVGAQTFDIANKASLYNTHSQLGDANLTEANNLVSQMSYVGLPINSSVDELQLEYQRSTFPSSPKNLAAVGTIGDDSGATKFTEAHSFQVGDVIAVAGVTGTDTPASIVAKVNGTHAISVIDTTTSFNIAVNVAPITTIALTTQGGTNSVFTKADHGLEVGDKFKMTGFTGTNESDINNKEVEISAVTDDTFTVALNTDSKNITGHGIITPDLDGSAATVKLQRVEDKVSRSKAEVNLLFWGECVKTLSVSNNVVTVRNN